MSDRYTLHHGDCLEVMAGMEDNSIDTVITDPPYHLVSINKRFSKTSPDDDNKTAEDARNGAHQYARLSSGFMGKEWDGGGIAFDPATWAEVLRVAKPGAMLLAFGGTRTFHRLACAIEDAGWIIRDCVMWLYGCLSEDTEILTDKGWQTYGTLFDGSMVMCYNVDNETFELMPTDEVIVYDYEDTAYHIKSDSTDQIVSRNHRCIVERGGRKVFRYAEALERQENVPILESLPEMRDSIPDVQSHSGQPQQTMFRLHNKKSQDKQEKETTDRKSNDASHLLYLWQEILQTQFQNKKNKAPLLQSVLQWSPAGQGMESPRSQGSISLDRGKQKILSEKDERQKQSSLEGWNHISQSQGQLPELQDQIYQMPGAIQGDGSQGWLCDGASSEGSSGNGQITKTVRSCASYQSQSRGQQVIKFDVVQQQYRSQEIRSDWSTSTTLATVTPIEYKGKMWCVRVPTGAFVARRNGRIFITGNSGFPKSHDISKAIDKRAGAEREVVGQNNNGAGNSGKELFIGGPKFIGEKEFNITAPATDAARLWDGWGSSLKPSWEPVILAMKPLDGTFAENALRWGVAGLWIDGARIETDDNLARINGGTEKLTWGGTYRAGPNNAALNGTQGRWPANLILSDDPEVTAGFPVTKSGGKTGGAKYDSNNSSQTSGQATFGKYNDTEHYCYGDSGSAARFFYCAKASKSERNHGLPDGMTNKHPTVKPLSLCQYLARLTKTPTGGIVLDPFCGSGSIGVAAILEGRQFIGIDQDADSVEVARYRLDAAVEETAVTQMELALNG